MKTKRQSKSSIYRNQDPQVRAVFERAGDCRKVVCVALDYAKRKHVALVCDGHGDILKAAFPVENNSRGVAFLTEQIEASVRRRAIRRDQVFIGGEDEPAYVANFTSALRQKGYLVVRVNAFEARERRGSMMASTDHIDLMGIAQTLISRRVRPSGDASPGKPVYQHLREVTRNRRTLVRQQTATSNRIHAMADQLFPGFLDESQSGLTPFCQASLELMRGRFSAGEISRRRPVALARLLRRHRVRQPDETAAKIIELARTALPAAAHRVATLQRTLGAAVDLYQCLARNAGELRTEAALALAATPYVFLTSLRGIGFVLAAGVAGELGDPALLGCTDSLCAFAGIVPKTYQTGGPDSPATQGHSTPRCNRILKDWTVQSAQKIHLYGPPELRERITRWNANGQHGIFAAARHYLRLVRSLVRNEVPYLQPAGRCSNPAPAALETAVRQTWDVLLQKWRTIPGGLELITNEANPPGLWRRVILELHGIELPLHP